MQNYLLDPKEETGSEPEASGDKVEQKAEVELEVTWDEVEDEWFEFGTDFLIF